MGIPVVSGAAMMCTMGTAPATLVVTSQTMVLMGGAPSATIQDVSPLVNITPCGMCISMANPLVASATAAALGVLTPQPCIPATVGVWMGGPTPLVSGIPGLQNDAKLTCSYGGVISVTYPGQTIVQY